MMGTSRAARGAYPSCTCMTPERVREARQRGTEAEIDPACAYHRDAAEHPYDHSIPWNCPTYHDGCNCKEQIAALRERLKAVEGAGR